MKKFTPIPEAKTTTNGNKHMAMTKHQRTKPRQQYNPRPGQDDRSGVFNLHVLQTGGCSPRYAAQHNYRKKKTMEVILIMWPLMTLIAAMVIGKQKGPIGESLILGLLLGPLGWLCVFLGPDKARPQSAFRAGDALDDSNRAPLTRGSSTTR
jgi:hypothetical protein